MTTRGCFALEKSGGRWRVEEEILHTGRCLELPPVDRKYSTGCASGAVCHSGGVNPPRLRSCNRQDFSSLQIDLFWHGTTRTTKEATSGCFWWIIRKLSTQLAQSAATIDLEALRNPQSPMEKSREARSFASLLRLSPTSRERHDCVAASCSKANCATSQGGAPRSPSVGAVQQEQPGSLEVQGCAQTGLNAKQSSGGDLNARIQAGLGHFRTTTEHGSTTFAVAVNCVHPGGQCLPLFQTCILPK